MTARHHAPEPVVVQMLEVREQAGERAVCIMRGLDGVFSVGTVFTAVAPEIRVAGNLAVGTPEPVALRVDGLWFYERPLVQADPGLTVKVVLVGRGAGRLTDYVRLFTGGTAD